MGVGASAAIVQFNLVHCALAFFNESETQGHAGDGMILPVYLRSYVTQPEPWCMVLAASAVQTGYASASGIAAGHLDWQPQDLVDFSVLAMTCVVAMLVKVYNQVSRLAMGHFSCANLHMPADLSACAAQPEAVEGH